MAEPAQEWEIRENESYKKMLRHVPSGIQNIIKNSVIPEMKIYPFTEKKTVKLRDNLEPFYEYKIKNRLVFRVNLNSKKV